MQFEEIKNLICTKCGSGLTHGNDEIICGGCNSSFPFKNGIGDFRRNDSYWCNVPREKMRSLIEDAVSLGDWEKASVKHIPDYMEHFTSCKRADFRFLLPFDKDSVVLDAGAMWGGISIPLAKEVKTLYAVDQTLETIEFLNVRARQSGIGNIIALASGLDKLPFRDGMFDLIIMSGVLEWVAMEEEAVISRDYYKPRENYKTYKLTPSEAQINVLKEIRRVMKSDGVLYLSIENRYALPYFLGVPDEHVNIKYIPLMPRKIADIIARMKLNSPYRTYTYSGSRLKEILEKSGFQDVRIMGCHPHYIEPEFICPSGRCSHYLKKYRKSLGRKYSLLSRILPSGILSQSIPSLVAISGDGKRIEARNSKIISMIEKHPEIKIEKPLKEIALVKSRKGDNLPAFYEIYVEDKETPAYFCKVARDPRSALILEEEFRNIKSFREATKDSFQNISPLLGFINNDDFK
ncbi:MAG: class I SAM-dependent methyltransferase, partial [Victivallales bacterium]